MILSQQFTAILRRALSTVLVAMLLLAHGGEARPSKLSRMTIDVCPYPAMYAEVQQSILRLEMENRMLSRQLAEHHEANGELTKALKVMASSVSDSSEMSLECAETTKLPLRLRGGDEGASRHVSRCR
ncbi:hypothetical protein GUITHDRAFT_150039 [Guillardia theta CCMP2712]|uniref:Uncharacterized protein n=2 Tax=Guillardia theta TaxID=55529 RepID=L1K1P2_GUITC|nr:hypothetical protein GUITHDRAFT_150039 [Guillardia theta CCMP2712]EKX54532.1 hypothetical protein GUITHDRAFT_150039 [Guillardia theta CCMP2712]|eukprot:XP_005841512.1 hypothetical protein GUITHDRAFT_150039 [Guillardia theta CCMP2712]